MSEQDEYANWLEHQHHFKGESFEGLMEREKQAAIDDILKMKEEGAAVDKALGIQLLPPIRVDIDDVEILGFQASLEKTNIQAIVRNLVKRHCDDIRASGAF